MKKLISSIMCAALILTGSGTDVYAENAVFYEEDITEDIIEYIPEDTTGDADLITENEDLITEYEEPIEDDNSISEEDDILAEEDDTIVEELPDIEDDSTLRDSINEIEVTEAIVNDGSDPDNIDKLLSTDVTVTDGKDVDVKEIPYGHAAGEAFLLTKQNELMLTISDGRGKDGSNYQ